MADIFDQLAAPSSKGGGDIFDSIASSKHAKPGFLDRAYETSVGAVKNMAEQFANTPGSNPYVRAAQAFVVEPAKALVGRMADSKAPLPLRPLEAVGSLIVPDVAAKDFAEGNIRGGLGGVAGNAALFLGPKAISKGAKSAPVAAARNATAAALEDSARAQYGRVLNPTKQGTKFLSQKQVVPELIERGVTSVTMKGLKDKVSTQVSKLGQAIGDYWEQMPDDALAPINDIVDRVRAEAVDTNTVKAASGKRIPMSDVAARAMDQAESLATTLEAVAEVDAKGIKQVPVKRLRELRQHYDEIAARAKRYQGAELAEQNRAEVFGKVADAIREEFAKADPSLAALNKEFSFWKNAEKVVEETILRREGQARPLGRKIAEAAGTAVGATSGPVGALLGKYGMGLLEKVITSPAWNTMSAVAKDRLAKAIATGKQGKAIIELEKLRKEAVSSTALVPRNATPNE